MRPPLLLGLALLAPAPLAGDELFVGGVDGVLYAGDPVAGGFDPATPPSAPVRAVAQLGNRVLVAFDDGVVQAYGLGSGLVDDLFEVELEPTDMVVHDGTLLVSAADGTIQRVNPVDGTVIETFVTGFEVQALALDGDVLFAGTPFGVFHQKDLGDDSPFAFAGLCGGPINSIVSTDEELYLGDTTGNVYVYDKSTGFVTYAYTVANDATSIVQDGEHFLIGGSDGSIIRVLPPFGTVIDELTAPAGVDDLLLVQPESALVADRHELSVSAGASVELRLHVHADVPGTTYWMLGSLSGKGPFAVGDTLLPLTFDFYTVISMQPTGPLAGSLGTLDAAGDGSVFFDVPAGTNPSLAGATVHHASFIANLADPELVVGATNAVGIALQL